MLRIDRALVSLDWEEHFENISQRVLPRIILDHYSLLLELVLFDMVGVPLNLKICD